MSWISWISIPLTSIAGHVKHLSHLEPRHGDTAGKERGPKQILRRGPGYDR